jgi:hypothetical protein
MTVEDVLMDLVRRFNQFNENPGGLVGEAKVKVRVLLDENRDLSDEGWYSELEKAEVCLSSLGDCPLAFEISGAKKMLVSTLKELKFGPKLTKKRLGGMMR